MSQHSQLAAGSGYVPADGQQGDVLAGPARFGPPARPRPARVATVGVEPFSFLRRAILWRAFGVENVEALPADGFTARPTTAEAMVVHQVPHPPVWEALLAWAGERTVVVDVHDAAAMAAAGGCPLRVQMAAGTAAPALQVMCQAENRAVYPGAPAVEIVADPPAPTGFAAGDAFQLFAPSPIDPGLRVLADDAALAAFAARCGAVIWGRERDTRGVALLSCPTPAGGLVTVMDLQAVDRMPDPAGSETPGIQLLLALLGISPVVFGRFVTAHARYGDFIDDLHDLARRFSRFAALEPIGRSVEGRDLWLMKVARQPELPAVLLTCAIHPYEWSATYGVLRYLRFLLERLEAGDAEAGELLGERQLWWVPSACPDGFDDRRQQPSAINLNRNFPAEWELAAPGQLQWGAFGRLNTVNELAPISLRGPAPASQPETRALMGLLDRRDASIATLADFHENTGPKNYLCQHEDGDGVIAHLDYHAELLEGVTLGYGNRFFEQRQQDFGPVTHDPGFHPTRIGGGWLGYARSRGARGFLIEATGGDCTHYRTVRRVEYAALVAEQALANELGRLYRNPWGSEQVATLHARRRPARIAARVFDAGGRLLEETVESGVAEVTRTVPPGGCLRLRYEEE